MLDTDEVIIVHDVRWNNCWVVSITIENGLLVVYKSSRCINDQVRHMSNDTGVFVLGSLADPAVFFHLERTDDV